MAFRPDQDRAAAFRPAQAKPRSAPDGPGKASADATAPDGQFLDFRRPAEVVGDPGQQARQVDFRSEWGGPGARSTIASAHGPPGSALLDPVLDSSRPTRGSGALQGQGPMGRPQALPGSPGPGGPGIRPRRWRPGPSPSRRPPPGPPLGWSPFTGGRDGRPVAGGPARRPGRSDRRQGRVNPATRATASHLPARAIVGASPGVGAGRCGDSPRSRDPSAGSLPDSRDSGHPNRQPGAGGFPSILMT